MSRHAREGACRRRVADQGPTVIAFVADHTLVSDEHDLITRAPEPVRAGTARGHEITVRIGASRDRPPGGRPRRSTCTWNE
jgi:hypothetical protein